MNKIIGLYIGSEWKKHWLSNLRQILFLVPIISISLLMSTLQNIKYINQSDFLNSVNYKSITKSAEITEEKNVFKVYDGSLAVVEIVRNANVYRNYYHCQIFNLMQNNYDFENTYFTKMNMEGYNPLDLKEDEIIISYDTAKKLNVGLNDTISLVSFNGKEMISYTIKGIMKTKYAYNKIGSAGTAIINDSTNDKLAELYPNSNYYTFNKDTESELSNITLEQEKWESNFLNLPQMSVLVVNGVFPCLGLMLIFIIIFREIGRKFKAKKKDFSILMSLGLDRNVIILMLSGTQLIIICLSSILAILLYKYLFVQKLIGQYVSYILTGKLFVLCMIIGCIAIYINVHFIKRSLMQLDIVKLLYDKEEL